MPLGAQLSHPRTAASVPPAANDSIYKLAVKPSAYPEKAFVYLLDDGVVRLDAAGRGTRTYRQVIEILKPEAVDRFREQTFSYSPLHQKFTLNWLRVIRANGEIIERPSQVQDSDIPAVMGDPVYSDVKVKRASLTGLEPGALLDYSITTEELKPFLAGDFLLQWSVTTGAPTLRSDYIVDFPASLAPRIKERNLTFKRNERTGNDRRIYTWALHDVPAIDAAESFAADSNGVMMSIGIGSPQSWSAISKWYAENARDRYAVAPPLAAKIDSVVRSSRTLDDSIRAIHKWVAQDIRYVSIALGLGGYQPRAPETVVNTGFGDCKDKATLFIASLTHIGVTAFPVLLNSYGRVDRDLPSISQFNHAIAAIQTTAGYKYVDMTADLVPYGRLPLGEQGEFGLVVHPDGRGEEITFPTDPVSENRRETRLTGSINTEGKFNGWYEESGAGGAEYQLREMFEHPLDSAMRENLPRQIASQIFEGATGDSITGFDGKDFSAKPTVRVRIANGNATQSAGTTEILTLPFGSMAEMASMARNLARKPKRLFPIDLSRVVGTTTIVTDMSITLPAGWTAKLPHNVSVTGPFGTYESTYAQNGQDLRATRTMAGVKGILPPDRITDLIAFLAAVGKDDARFIAIEKGAAPK